MRGVADTILTLKPEDAPKTYESFMKRAVGAPSTAILFHYSLIDPEIPVSIGVSPEVLVAVNALFSCLWDCNASIGGIARPYQTDLANELSRLRDEITTRIGRHLKCTLADVERLSERLNHWWSRYSEVHMYQRLWSEAEDDDGGEVGQQLRDRALVLEVRHHGRRHRGADELRHIRRERPRERACSAAAGRARDLQQAIRCRVARRSPLLAASRLRAQVPNLRLRDLREQGRQRFVENRQRRDGRSLGSALRL